MEPSICYTPDCSEVATVFDREGAWCSFHFEAQEAARRAAEKAETIASGGPWPQTCPRRLGDFTAVPETNSDTWDIRTQFHLGLKARHCSYCGSLHPDDFMDLIKEKWVLGPTDKSYKVYLGKPRPPEADSSSHDFVSTQQTKFYFQHLSDEQMDEFISLFNDHKLIFGYPGYFYTMPFFMKVKTT